MAKIGRPSKYKKKFCNMLIDHMSKGFSFESFAGVAKVNQDTLHEWKKVHREFSEAKNIASGISMLWWERIGIAAMIGQEIMLNGKKQKININTAMWIFNMKNRFGWSDNRPEDFLPQRAGGFQFIKGGKTG